ncbi:MAG: riboflavin synthase, alpha subunit [halophilic archaeon J07HX64]|jgi:riboflavin synthase, alpha subunit|nr:MAG: riboflavin synthase, alpha subunit [halophilic archaeon J07HX64]
MFTGIVEETGEVRAVEESADGRRLRIDTSMQGFTRGQSISISGACLTVEDYDGGSFEVFLASETVDRTYLGELDPGDRVNVERALPADGRLDGHFVQGHVDGTAQITTIRQIDEDWRFGFSLPPGLASYVVEKGSISIDGISLTVAALAGDEFEAAIIPETYDLTTLSTKSVGDPVHLEVDVVAKYVESLVEGYDSGPGEP